MFEAVGKAQMYQRTRETCTNIMANISDCLTFLGSEPKLNEFLFGARANLIRLRHFAHVYNLHPN